MTQIIDIHTHCAPRDTGDPFGIAAMMRGTPVGKNMLTNFRGLPAVGYGDLHDFDLQQEVSAAAGISGRIISNPFAAESISWASKSRTIDIVKAVNDQVAETVARSPKNWGLGTLDPLAASHVKEAERCLGGLGFKGVQICTSWHSRFIDGEDAFAFWEWADDQQVPVFIHPPRVPIGHEQQMDQYKLDELVGRPFDTAMAMARMILSGLFDRYPHLRLVVAHMGGGLLPCMGRLDFGWRLGCEGMPERAVMRCKQLPSSYLERISVDTMGFWAPHVRETVRCLAPSGSCSAPTMGRCRSIPRSMLTSSTRSRSRRPTKKRFSGATPPSFSISRSPADSHYRGAGCYATSPAIGLTSELAGNTCSASPRSSARK